MNTPVTCPSCGTQLTPEARFCPVCGKPVSANAPIPPPLPITPPAQATPAIPPPGQPFPPIVPPVQATPAIPPPGQPFPPIAPPVQSTPAIPPPGQPFPPVAPPIQPPAAGIAPPSIPLSSEKVLCVIGMVTKKTGVFSSDLYHMVVTDRRLIFARQTKEMQSADVNRAREQAKQAGKGVFGQIGAQMGTRHGDKYLSVAPDLILRENPQNFAIDLNQVTKIATYHADFEDNSPDTMEVITPGQKYKFNIQNAYNVERELKQYLGQKVK